MTHEIPAYTRPEVIDLDDLASMGDWGLMLGGYGDTFGHQQASNAGYTIKAICDIWQDISEAMFWTDEPKMVEEMPTVQQRLESVAWAHVHSALLIVDAWSDELAKHQS